MALTFTVLQFQVRKTSQAALLVLLEGELVDRGKYIIKYLLPVLKAHR